MGATERDRKRSRARDWLDDRLSEFFQPGGANLVGLARELNYKAELLKHDVEKMIRVQADAFQFTQLLAQDCQTWMQHLGRNANDACCVRSVMGPPVRRIVAPIDRGLAPLELLPDTLEGDG